jgi:hypothetical protein
VKGSLSSFWSQYLFSMESPYRPAHSMCHTYILQSKNVVVSTLLCAGRE